MPTGTTRAAEPAVLLLHGDLDLTIHEARGLPNMDVLSTLLRRLCLRPTWASTGSRGRGRPSRSITGLVDAESESASPRSHRPRPHGRHHLHLTSDPYAVVLVPPDTTLARTHVERNSEAPEWSARMRLHLAHEASRLLLHVKDSDPFGSDLIGVASLPAAVLLAAADQPIVDAWLELLRPDGRGPPRTDSAIRISASFTPAFATPAPGYGVPAYFPPRRGCDVKLYHDASAGSGAGGCWEDVCAAVLGAQSLVYVVGWAVSTRIRLIRSEMSAEMAEKVAEARALGGGGSAVEEMTLGELLKYKSEEGVRVCLLVWDDKTSHDNPFLTTGGVMKTGDEETKKFFKHSSVICVLSPRYPSSKLSMVKQKVVGTLYTHHQKCVLVDTAASETTRRITAFVGGLDLAAGRYDTPEHALFGGLDTVFRGDIHNPTFGFVAGGSAAEDRSSSRAGPRQPWHDMHCRVDGAAAYDVLRNFEQRWRKATKLRAMFGRAAKHWKDDSLLKLDRIPWILSPAKSGHGSAADDDDALRVLPENDPQCWHAQVFRSVDSGSVTGFPRYWDTKEMAEKHLLCDKNVAVDQSIHTAYVAAIRSARRFIYVENQYFIGSSYAWPSYRQGSGAGNLVPMEIALKVASKIRSGEDFAAYVVVPMWPEGHPGAGPMQEILYWQSQTMQMMYEVVARAIADSGPGRRGGAAAHPQDYLNFYCLGKREAAVAPVVGNNGGRGGDPLERARRHRRFMIYVHSKGMIVDDEYVIVGSANINQRSLAGSRDTEIAVGAHQPNHHHHYGGGDVRAYRMSLWEEHLGSSSLPAMVENPESPACVKLVNRVARENWERYADEREEAAVKMQGHLMRYPVAVGADGKVGPLHGHEYFPDVGGRVVGSPNNYPDNLTM